MFGYPEEPLRNVKVASPCPADWDAMYGNERVRFCSECKLNVYNLSGMRKVDAERLLASVEGRLCVRYYRRPDGTILTKDCPVGLAAARQRAIRLATAVAGIVIGLFTGSATTMAFRSSPPPRPPIAPRHAEMGDIGPTPNEPMMGAVTVQGGFEPQPPDQQVVGRVAQPVRRPASRR